MSEINKTRDLRAYICHAIKMAGNGTLDEKKVKNIVALSKQIHESFYAEARVAKMQMELSRDVSKLGELVIGDDG